MWSLRDVQHSSYGGRLCFEPNVGKLLRPALLSTSTASEINSPTICTILVFIRVLGLAIRATKRSHGRTAGTSGHRGLGVWRALPVPGLSETGIRVSERRGYVNHRTTRQNCDPCIDDNPARKAIARPDRRQE